MNPLRVAVVGAGAMGRLHARALARRAAGHGDCELACVLDPHPERSRAVATEFGGESVSRLETLRSGVDAAVVAVPTRAHDRVARALMGMGIDVLIEKPLSGRLEEARKTVALATELGRVLGVGHVEWHNMRIRRALEAVGEPIEIEVERFNSPLDRGLDIDVVQDFMLHDLDWVKRAVHSEITSIEASGRAIRNHRLDEAEATLRFESGCRARLRVDRLHADRVRRIRIVGRLGTRSIDLLDGTSPGSASGPTGAEPDSTSGSTSGSRGRGAANPRVRVNDERRFDEAEPLDLEWADFLRACRERTAPENDGAVALAAIELVERVRAQVAASGGHRADDPVLGG